MYIYIYAGNKNTFVKRYKYISSFEMLSQCMTKDEKYLHVLTNVF